MKKSFYLKYIENKKKTRKSNKIKQKYKLDDNTIIIEKSSNFFIRLFNLFINGMRSSLKWIIYILAMIFISIGLTAIINSNIRQIIIDLMLGGKINL